MSGGCGEAVWWMWRGLFCECKLSVGCGEYVWCVGGSCLGVLGCCLQGKEKLTEGCVEVVWWVWVGCLVGVGRLSGVWDEAVW